jgi:hypothetical protein
VFAGTSSESCTALAALGPLFVTWTEKIACPPDEEVLETADFETLKSAVGLAWSITVKEVIACTVPPNGSKRITRQSPRLDDVVSVKVALPLADVIGVF